MYYKYKPDPLECVNTKGVDSDKDCVIKSVENREQSITFHMHIYTKAKKEHVTSALFSTGLKTAGRK